MTILKVQPIPTPTELDDKFSSAGVGSDPRAIADALGIQLDKTGVVSPRELSEYHHELTDRIERAGVDVKGDLKTAMTDKEAILIAQQKMIALTYLEDVERKLSDPALTTLDILGNPGNALELTENKNRMTSSLGAVKEHLDTALAGRIDTAIGAISNRYESLYLSMSAATAPATAPTVESSLKRTIELLIKQGLDEPAARAGGQFRWADVAPLNRAELEAMSEPERNMLSTRINQGLENRYKELQLLQRVLSSGSLSQTLVETVATELHDANILAIPKNARGEQMPQYLIPFLLPRVNEALDVVKWLQTKELGTHDQRIENLEKREKAVEWLEEKNALIQQLEAMPSQIAFNKCAAAKRRMADPKLTENERQVAKTEMESEDAEFKNHLKADAVAIRDLGCRILGVPVEHFDEKGSIYSMNPRTQKNNPDCRMGDTDHELRLALDETARAGRRHRQNCLDIKSQFDALTELRDNHGTLRSKLGEVLAAATVAANTVNKVKNKNVQIEEKKVRSRGGFFRAIGSWAAKSSIGVFCGWGIYKILEATVFQVHNTINGITESYVASGPSNIAFIALPVIGFMLAHRIPTWLRQLRG